MASHDIIFDLCVNGFVYLSYHFRKIEEQQDPTSKTGMNPLFSKYSGTRIYRNLIAKFSCNSFLKKIWNAKLQVPLQYGDDHNWKNLI